VTSRVLQMMDHPELTEEMIRAMNAIAADGRDRSLAPVVINKPLDQFRDAYRLIMNREVVGKACVMWQPEEKAKM
jgi:hypothetical protein